MPNVGPPSFSLQFELFGVIRVIRVFALVRVIRMVRVILIRCVRGVKLRRATWGSWEEECLELVRWWVVGFRDMPRLPLQLMGGNLDSLGYPR